MAFVAAADGGNNGGTTNSLTFSYTCGSGSNRLLVVAIAGDVVAGADDITGVTYNGVAMSLACKTAGGNRFNYFYYLVNPASGANNVVISATTSHYLLAGAADYTGISALDATNTNSGASITTLTTSLTTIANNCWVILIGNSYDGGPQQNAGTGSTRRTFDAAFGIWTLFDSAAAITPAGSYSMTSTVPGSATNMSHCMASFSPAGAGGGVVPLYMHRTQQRMN